MDSDAGGTFSNPLGKASHLIYLHIVDFPSHASLRSKSKFPAILEEIELDGCSTLSSLSSGGNLHKALKKLQLYNVQSYAQ